MKKHSVVKESFTEFSFARPNWPWWLVMWKAFITLFIIGCWGMMFMWALLIGMWFMPVPNSVATSWKIIFVALLNILPAWALWALAVSVWTERQGPAIKGGLAIGALLGAYFAFRATQQATYDEDPTAAAIRQELTLPFCLLTVACFIWELRRQFKAKNNQRWL
jgi:H+/Cl- antiporter ClcA